MELRVRHTGHVTVVDVAGKIAIGNGDAMFRERMLELLENKQKHILLNLEKVSYVDSAGLGELGACHKRAEERDAKVKLLMPSEKVCEVLRVVKFDEVFEIYRDETGALSSFADRVA